MHLKILLKYDFLTLWAWILPELLFAWPLSLQIFQSAECRYCDGGVQLESPYPYTASLLTGVVCARLLHGVHIPLNLDLFH